MGEMIIRDLLGDLLLPDWLRIESEEKLLSKFLEMVMQATEGKKKDNVKWFCYLFEEEKTKKRFVKIAIGPIMSDIVPLIQKKIEERCGAKIQQYDFRDGRGVFFVKRIESTTDILSANSAIQRKLKEPGGKEEIKKEIEGIVEKLDNAFKKFNDMIDAMMVM